MSRKEMGASADEIFIRRTLSLAEMGRGRTSPNPMVGSVVVKDGKVIGEGFHRAAGEPHAEVVALREAGGAARGATLYVTLEPCCHYGRTPPCTDLIIRSGVKRVVAAMEDPNPVVSGRGFRRLAEAGIEVRSGVLEGEARRLNEVFIKYITTGCPFVVMKFAMSLDGKIATSAGESRWISCEESRRAVHHLRDRYDAVMVGVGTILADDPMLTTRLNGNGRDPRRIVVDSSLRTPPDARAINPSSDAPTLIAVTEGAERERFLRFDRKNVEFIVAPAKEGRVDLEWLMLELGRRKITSVLLEGGSTLNAGAIQAGIVDKVAAFIAPILIGGSEAPGPIGGSGVERLSEAVELTPPEVEFIGKDMLVTAYVRKG